MRFNRFLFTPHFSVDTGAMGGGDSTQVTTPTDSTPTNTQSWGGVTPEAKNPLLVDPTPAQTPVQNTEGTTVNEPSNQTNQSSQSDQTTQTQPVNPELEMYKQQVEQMNKMLQFYQTQLQQMAQMQMQQSQTQAQPVQPEPEPFDKEKFFEVFYENPEEAFAKLNASYQRQLEQKLAQIEERFQTIVEPMVRERQYANEINVLSQKYPDFQQHAQTISRIIQQNPKLLDTVGLEQVYFMAKGLTMQSVPTPEQLIQDPNFRARILSDKQIQQEFLRQYMQQKQETNKQTPPVMGNQVGGQAPTAPPQTPKTLKEASQAFLRFLGENK